MLFLLHTSRSNILLAPTQSSRSPPSRQRWRHHPAPFPVHFCPGRSLATEGPVYGTEESPQVACFSTVFFYPGKEKPSAAKFFFCSSDLLRHHFDSSSYSPYSPLVYPTRTPGSRTTVRVAMATYSGASTPERRPSSEYKLGSNAEKGDALGDKDVRIMQDGSGVGTTHRGLTARHITFIGIGGGIGTVSRLSLASLPAGITDPPSLLHFVGSLHWYRCRTRKGRSCWFAIVSPSFFLKPSPTEQLIEFLALRYQGLLRRRCYPVVCHGIDRRARYPRESNFDRKSPFPSHLTYQHSRR